MDKPPGTALTENPALVEQGVRESTPVAEPGTTLSLPASEAAVRFMLQRQSKAPNSLWMDAWRRLTRDKLAIAGMLIIVLFVIAAVFAPLLAPYDPIEQTLLQRRQPPSRQHWMGLDEVGVTS